MLISVCSYLVSFFVFTSVPCLHIHDVATIFFFVDLCPETIECISTFTPLIFSHSNDVTFAHSRLKLFLAVNLTDARWECQHATDRCHQAGMWLVITATKWSHLSVTVTAIRFWFFKFTVQPTDYMCLRFGTYVYCLKLLSRNVAYHYCLHAFLISTIPQTHYNKVMVW